MTARTLQQASHAGIELDEIYDRACDIAFDLSPAVIGFGCAPDGESFIITIDRSWRAPVDLPSAILGVPVLVERRLMPHIPADSFA